MRIRIQSGNRTGSILALVFLSVFVFAGLSVCMLGIGLLSSSNNSSSGYEKITATISNITAELDANGEGYDYDVYVDYTYKGQEYYDIWLNLYSSSMYIGEEIDVMVDKQNPSRIKSSTGKSTGIFVIVFGAVFILVPIGVGIGIIRGMLKAKDGINYIKKKGEQIRAVIEDIVEEPHSGYGGTKLYRVFCTYEDIERNTIYRFVSNPVGEEVTISLSPGMSIPVFVNKRNYTEYYVDLGMYGSRNVVDLTQGRRYY